MNDRLSCEWQAFESMAGNRVNRVLPALGGIEPLSMGLRALSRSSIEPKALHMILWPDV